MYVKRFCYDDWSKENNIDQEIIYPNWDEIEEIILQMDGKKITQITMDNGDEDNYFCIGGGNKHLFNVYVSLNDNEEIFNLVNPNAKDGKTYKLVTGGQEGEFEEKTCISLEMVIKAAKVYYKDGKMERSLNWFAAV